MGIAAWVTRHLDDLDSESDKIAEDYIDRQYFGLIGIAGWYIKMSRRRWPLTLLQIAFMNIVIVTHWLLIVKPSFSLIDISFVIFGENIHFCLLLQLVFILINFMQSKHQDIAVFHKAMACNFFDYSEPYEGIMEKLQEEIRRERMLLVPIPVSVAIGAAGVLLFAPAIDQFGSFDFNRTSSLVNDNLPFPFAQYPYQTEEGMGYYASSFFQMVAGFILSCSIGVGGFAYIVMSQSLSVQMKILLDSLGNIERRTTLLLAKLFGVKYNCSGSKLYRKEKFAFCYNMCLRNNFRHHQIIMRYFRLWAGIFSVPVFLAYLTGTIVIALSLLSVNSLTELPGTTAASLVLCGAEVGYMFLFSVFSQRLTDLNEDLRYKMYCIKWYYCDEGVRRSLRIFQEVTMRPMTLVAGGIVPANMDTFAKVMNSSYSYYNLVNAFNIA